MMRAPLVPGDITAAILAGGQGSRVGGEDKGLLVLRGEPLVAHAWRRLRGQADRLLVCANRNLDAYAPYAPVVADPDEGFRGPLAGIAAALAACTTPWLLTVPVDAPDLPLDLAQRLAQASDSEAPRAVVSDGRREPLFALYPRELASSARAALAGDASVWRWQDACGTIAVDMSSQASAFANLNTADDFSRWEAAHHD
jgi:molybdopterin-guanine dinucleotide biosynthesis protein A